jgi:hypothetical protein
MPSHRVRRSQPDDSGSESVISEHAYDNDSTHTPTSSHPSQHRHTKRPAALLFKARKFLSVWTTEWGPIDCWSPRISRSFHNATKDDPDGENECRWRGLMLAKAHEGRCMLEELKNIYRTLPNQDWEVEDMWYQALDLVKGIQAGITSLEVLVAVLSGA